MNDPTEKFMSHESQLEAITEALETIIGELDAVLDAEADCLSCGYEDSECPDCEKCDADEEGDTDV